MTVSRCHGRPISDHANQQTANGSLVDRVSGSRWQSDPVDQGVTYLNCSWWRRKSFVVLCNKSCGVDCLATRENQR
jgi:hypothetical protein